jgi:hypothetical protein
LTSPRKFNGSRALAESGSTQCKDTSWQWKKVCTQLQ